MSNPFDTIRHWQTARNEKGWWHSFELPGGTRIDGVASLESLQHRIAQFPIPGDLRGKRVLDIGTWDGWFAFEMERRGAEVVAIDCWDNPRFHEMHARLGSRVEFREIDMYDLTPATVGRFDIVLFMGVLYHLKHPLLALERVCALTMDMAAVDSFILREEHRPGVDLTTRAVMEFYEHNEMGGQTDNWVGPSEECLLAFCRTAGFARVELRSVIEHSACVACYRRWTPLAANPPAGPELLGAFHPWNDGINFDSRRDDYICAWFAWPEAPARGELMPRIGDFGVHPLHVAASGEGRWQVNFRLPPGLEAGWHDVTLRIGRSAASNARRIAVDLPAVARAIEVTSVCDATTWEQNRLDRAKGRWLALWVAGLPENGDRNNVRVYLDGRRLKVTHVEAGGVAARQVNVEVPEDVARGAARIGVALGGTRSNAVGVEIG